MPVFSASQQTQFGMAGFGVRPAGSFAGKTLAAILTITLPTAVWDGTGQAPEIIVKNVSSSTNEIQLDADGSETIDGDLTVSITAGRGRIHLISDGTNWMRVD